MVGLDLYGQQWLVWLGFAIVAMALFYGLLKRE
jgi:LPXTG-motif cell wall-anchored protein